MGKINEKLGTDYEPVQLLWRSRMPIASSSAMGSFCDVLEEVIDYLNAHGEKVGLVKVRLFRPFSIEQLCRRAIPATVKKIAVLDRTKEPGVPLASLSTRTLSPHCYEAGRTDITGRRRPLRPGLQGHRLPLPSSLSTRSSRRTSPSASSPSASWTTLPTSLCLEPKTRPNTAAPGTIECKFWGLGGDGTVGANKNSIKIIGDHTDKYVQAYFQYDSKKTGGVTVSHLRFGDTPITQPVLHRPRPTSSLATTPATSPRASRWSATSSPAAPS